MNVALAKVETSQTQGELFAAARGRLPGGVAAAQVRQAAFDDFLRRGLPHRRIEEWKYTDLRALLNEVAPLAAAPDKAALALAADAVKALGITGTMKLVLVDGVFAPQLSDINTTEAGVSVRTLQDVLDSADSAETANVLRTTSAADAMISLNAAMATDGFVVDVAAKAVLVTPIHVIHVATRSAASSFTRSLVTVEAGAKATLVESFVTAGGAKAYQVHDSVAVRIGEGAELEHVRLKEDARDAANITTAIFTVGAKAKLNTFNLTHGGSVSRYQGFIDIVGAHASVATNGVNLLNGSQHGDTTLEMNHLAPDCPSREVFRAVLDDRAKSVFQGRINVHQIAQKTDAKMMTRALLLSDEAEAYNKPELEIFADDVQCGHGATVGALDDNLLFYLRARGLPEKAAEALLILAFVGEAIESIVNDELRELAEATASRWLDAR